VKETKIDINTDDFRLHVSKDFKRIELKIEGSGFWSQNLKPVSNNPNPTHLVGFKGAFPKGHFHIIYDILDDNRVRTKVRWRYESEKEGREILSKEFDLSDLPSLTDSVMIFNHKEDVPNLFLRRLVDTVDVKYAIESMDKIYNLEDADEINKRVSRISVRNLLSRKGLSWGTNADFHVISHPKGVIIISVDKTLEMLEEKFVRPLVSPIKKFLWKESRKQKA